MVATRIPHDPNEENMPDRLMLGHMQTARERIADLFVASVITDKQMRDITNHLNRAIDIFTGHDRFIIELCDELDMHRLPSDGPEPATWKGRYLNGLTSGTEIFITCRDRGTDPPIFPGQSC